MKLISTRNAQYTASIEEAIQHGLANDGGLYIPDAFPQFEFNTLPQACTYTQFSHALLAPFFEHSQLKNKLPELINAAFNFPVPQHTLSENTTVLELFHGPTLSFKDFGARFLAQCLSQLAQEHPIMILVATSGDTGSAVASAFHQLPGTQVIVLYPEGKISTRQRKQITTWGDNVHALSVQGTFDDCQRLVKHAYQHPDAFPNTRLSTANSINIGRLLPQMTYFAFASWQHWKTHQTPLNILIPSGNLGHVTACFWAKTMGLPIQKIAIASNANTVLSDYVMTGEYTPRPSIETLANAMDVGNPSNFERLQHLFPHIDAFKSQVNVHSVTDDEILDTIKKTYHTSKYFICPHTATAIYARKHYAEDAPWMIAGTAHPAKFETVIEPHLKCSVAIPAHLQKQLERPEYTRTIAPDLQSLFKEITAVTKN